MPNKQLWMKIKDKIKAVISFLVKNNPITKERIKFFIAYVRRSWKSIAVILPLILVLYYSIGGYVTNNIDKNVSFEAVGKGKGLAIVNAGSDLIKREVDDNMWTPNLPFIFPGFVLDNMPSFQTGVIQSVSSSMNALSKFFDSEELKEASELLKYPPNIWILSKGDNLALAPSSGAQYRKARKELLAFNKNVDIAASEAKTILDKLLKNMEKDLNKISTDLDNQVQEFSSNWVDFGADNVFYLSQGRMYAYYVLLKAMSHDFKSIIVEAKQYEKLTSVMKSLEDGFLLDPAMVRNGKIDGVVSANHLMTLNYHVVKAKYNLVKIQHNLTREAK